VRFGNYICSGTNALVEVHFGENSIVEANSVVTKDFPPIGIWGVFPAKFISRKKVV
jgi:serine acetyltransferase